MLQIKNLRFQYTKEQTLAFPDIHCAKGEHSLLLGQSGSGKTTLLHLLGGLRTPDSGNVLIDGTSINELPQAKRDRFRGQKIGIIFQQAHFVQSLNVEENLALAQQLAGIAVDRTRIKTLLDRLQLGHKLHAKTARLSQGEQQRVAIARALINQPSIILADEPTSALDDKNTQQVIELLEEQAQLAKATLLIVTHDNRLKERFSKCIELV